VPRNPKAAALARAASVQANFTKAEAHHRRLVENRKQAMVRCVEAGATLTETGRIFGVSTSAISNVMAEHRKGGE
jgi:hypothetical protein